MVAKPRSTPERIPTRQLAALLRLFAIVPETIRTADDTSKGYKLSAFVDAFARYLPHVEPSHRHNPQKSRDIDPSASVTTTLHVTDLKPMNANETATCGVVTDEPPLPGAAEGFDALDDPEPARWSVKI